MSSQPDAVLPVGAIPEREDPIAREARTAAVQFFAAVAVGAVLTKAAWDSRLRWPWLNLPVALVIGSVGSLAGFGVARGVDALAERVPLPVPAGVARFWSRYVAASVVDAIGFDLAASRLDGISLWRGSYAWAWTIGWPLASLMLAANAVDVEAGERVAAARRTLLHPLSDLRNRRAMDADLAALARDRVPFVYVLADLDHLKRLNDSLGHQMGDRAIKHFASSLDALAAVAYHWGGDEFAVLFPGGDREVVRAALVGVARAISNFGAAMGFALSASFGATVVAASDQRDPTEIAEAADRALYVVKHGGGGRLCFEAEQPIDLSRA
jgi:diguanylate cyclase (GGDEF)-like protein